MENIVDIFVDLDGVLVNYNLGYEKIGGLSTDKGKVKADRLKPYPHFYRNLEWMPDGQKLWNFLKSYHPNVLSSASNFCKYSKQDKIDWCTENLHLTGSKVIIVGYPNQKQRYAKPGSILIDDNEKNCQEWESKKWYRNPSGIAILHKNSDDTIHKLKALLNHIDTKHVQEAFEKIKDSELICENLRETFDELIDRT